MFRRRIAMGVAFHAQSQPSCPKGCDSSMTRRKLPVLLFLSQLIAKWANHASKRAKKPQKWARGAFFDKNRHQRGRTNFAVPDSERFYAKGTLRSERYKSAKSGSSSLRRGARSNFARGVLPPSRRRGDARFADSTARSRPRSSDAFWWLTLTGP